MPLGDIEFHAPIQRGKLHLGTDYCGFFFEDAAAIRELAAELVAYAEKVEAGQKEYPYFYGMTKGPTSETRQAEIDAELQAIKDEVNKQRPHGG